MFYKDYYIRTYEVDKNKRLLVPTLLNYLQDVMIHNVDSFGAGSDFHEAQDLLWVLIDYEIDIYKLPIGKTYIKCGTIPYSFKRFYGFRIWEVLDEEGNLLAKAKAKFVMTSFKTREIISPSREVLLLFKDALQNPTALPFTKNTPLTSKIISASKDKVKNTYIDINSHMNNVYYLILAYNNIPHNLLDDHFVEKVRITYKKECFIDDLLTVEGREDGNTLYYEIKKEDSLLSKITFKLKKTNT